MRFAVAVLAALAAGVIARPYTIPDNPDGVYLVSFDRGGQPVTKRLEASAFTLPRSMKKNAETAPATSLNKRGPIEDSPAHCTNRDIPSTGSYGSVQSCLGNFLDYCTLHGTCAFGSDGGVAFCRTGDTILAVCVYDQYGIPGSSGEIDEFNAVMDAGCGRWRSGWVWIGSWNKTYWRTTIGEGVCNNDYGGIDTNGNGGVQVGK